VAIPAATTVTSYYVIVSTLNGSSAAGPAAQYTYQPVVPTVTNIATASGGTTGSAAGGTSITITGTGFLSNSAGDSTTVNFVDTANPSNVLQASNLTVNSSTSITATTPSVGSTDLTYYVIVTTAPGGTSTQQASLEFTFQPFTPVVASVSPTNGNGVSQTLTLTGIGFVVNATSVTLVPTSGTGTLTFPIASVSVSNSTMLTFTVSGGVKGKLYYVEVTTTNGGNSGTGGAANEYTY